MPETPSRLPRRAVRFPNVRCGNRGRSVDRSARGVRYAAPALDKGLDIIELLAHEIEGLTLNEIAKGLGRTSSEIFRMVNGLCRRGYIMQQDGDRYSLTLKLFELCLLYTSDAADE